MNREIKFRAWDGSKMLHSENGDFYLMPYGLCDVPSSTGHEFTSHVYPLMQYTGLKDKNGADIYEGDVVVVTEPSENGFPEIKHKPVAVGWVIGGFGLGYVSNTMPDYWGYEIIGNIYQNPELIQTA